MFRVLRDGCAENERLIPPDERTRNSAHEKKGMEMVKNGKLVGKRKKPY